MTATAPTSASVHIRSLHPDIGDARLERSDNVLWSRTPEGAILHHLQHGAYLDLDALGFWLWCYLDGGRSVDQVMHECLQECLGEEWGTSPLRPTDAFNVIVMLLENGFVQERSS